jgi:hypothetical protein
MEMDKTIHGNCAWSQPAFSAVRTQLKRKPSPQFERALHFGLETALRFLHLYMIFAFEGHWDPYEPVRIE